MGVFVQLSKPNRNRLLLQLWYTAMASDSFSRESPLAANIWHVEGFFMTY